MVFLQTKQRHEKIELTIGGTSNLQLLQQLKERGANPHYGDESEHYIFSKIPTLEMPTSKSLVIISGREMAVPIDDEGYVKICDVYRTATKEFGFKHCPAEVAPHFCLQEKIEKGETLYLGMEWITCDSGLVRIFTVANLYADKPQWVGTSFHGPEVQVSPNVLWIFALN